jgi:hypothetical protein
MTQQQPEPQQTGADEQQDDTSQAEASASALDATVKVEEG